MRILVLSDIHANFTALQAVLKDAGEVEGTWCLGDIVGYGPDPNECIERVRGIPNLSCVQGNHDSAALGAIPLETFNNDARRSIEWLQNILEPRNYAFLDSLAEKITLPEATLAHGSPRNPIWEYILDLHSAAQNFKQFTTPVCMVGHTHLPIVYIQQAVTETFYDVNWMLPSDGETLTLTTRAILNPGSTGQPRDHDPRASYAIYDTVASTWQLHRVDYDIYSVQKRIHAQDLPARHASRLLEGW